MHILSETDPASYEIINPHGTAPFLLTCEHAGVAVPESLDHLGLPPEEFTKHTACDIGTAHLTRHLSFLLDAPAILGNYSRLVIDLNRPKDHVTLIVPKAEDRIVPGNAELSEAERTARLREIYDPYHLAVDHILDDMERRHHGKKFAMISIHSYTQYFYNFERPWDVTFLWVQDDRIARHGVRYFQNLNYDSADNLPYDIQRLGRCSITLHGDTRRIPNVVLEVRNDHIDAESGAKKWAQMVSGMLTNYRQIDDAFARYDGPEHIFDPDEERTYIAHLHTEAKQGRQG